MTKRLTEDEREIQAHLSELRKERAAAADRQAAREAAARQSFYVYRTDASTTSRPITGPHYDLFKARESAARWASICQSDMCVRDDEGGIWA